MRSEHARVITYTNISTFAVSGPAGRWIAYRQPFKICNKSLTTGERQ